jgi:hypothetical protein
MKFTIEVETDKDNTIKHAVVKDVIGISNKCKPPKSKIKLKRSPEGFPPGGISWLVFDEIQKARMIVLSQVHY